MVQLSVVWHGFLVSQLTRSLRCKWGWYLSEWHSNNPSVITDIQAVQCIFKWYMVAMATRLLKQHTILDVIWLGWISDTCCKLLWEVQWDRPQLSLLRFYRLSSWYANGGTTNYCWECRHQQHKRNEGNYPKYMTGYLLVEYISCHISFSKRTISL